jgi:hypothetical protein
VGRRAGREAELSIADGPARPEAGVTLRTRMLRPRWLSVTVVVWTAAWLTLPGPVEGAPLPPGRAAGVEEPLAGVSLVAPPVTGLRQALLAQGLTAEDADLVLARLTPAERAELAQRAAELGVGGDSGVLIIILILVVAILLYLPMAGRMQGWW